MEFPQQTASPPASITRRSNEQTKSSTTYKVLVDKLKRTRVDAVSRNVSRDSEADEKMTNGNGSQRSSVQSDCGDHNLVKNQFCLDDHVKVCLKCLLYGLHKSHKSLDLDIPEDR